MNWYKIAQMSLIEVFHGTNNPLEIFNSKKQLSGYYPGFYVSSSKEKALAFGNNIYTFMLQPSKYYEINNEEDSKELKEIANKNGYRISMGSGSGESKYLRDIGYHGINRGIEYIVFEPENNLKKEENNELV